MAQDIITAQQTEIGQLKSWRKEWYGSEATPPMNQMPMLPGMDMSMPMPNIDQQVSQLQTANPFDKAFIEDMIPHHEMAMDAAMIAQEKATHDEIQRMADDIIETQQAEIDQMKEWKASWYPAQ